MIADKTLDEALVELLRTKRALEALRTARKAETHDAVGRQYMNADEIIQTCCRREHAAAKRATLDLTRKLADLRAGR